MKRRISWALFLCLALALPAISPAWVGRGGRVSSEVTKPLTTRQAKSLVGKLVGGMVGRMFFHEDELARRVALGLISVDFQNSEVNDREFTDMVLNEMLNRTQLSVVNQEPILSMTSLDYKLVSYDGEWETRRRGLLLGADFVIVGRVNEIIANDEKGRASKIYKATLSVKNIRTGTVILEQTSEQTHRKPRRRS